MQIGLCAPLRPDILTLLIFFSANFTSEAKGEASPSLNSLLDDEANTINVSNKCLIFYLPFKGVVEKGFSW